MATYEPVTEWKYSSSTTGQQWLGAACRIVKDADTSTSESYHLYGEYSFYQWYKVNDSTTNNIYKYLQGIDYSLFHTDTPHEALYLNTSGTYPKLHGTVRRVELGYYAPGSTVTSVPFQCGWNNSTYSAAITTSYTIPTPTPPQPTETTFNKIVINGNSIIDLSADTVAAAVLLSGYTAHDKNGVIINGEYTGGDNMEIISNSVTHQMPQTNYSYTCYKFSNGLLIATFSQILVPAGKTNWSSFGDLFYSSIEGVPMPNAADSTAPAFIEAPYVIIQTKANWNLTGAQITYLNASSVNIWVYADNQGTSSASAVTGDFIAIGRWQ